MLANRFATKVLQHVPEVCMRMIDVTKGCNLGYESATVVYAIGTSMVA
jgi:hypothetical protein